MTIEEEINKIKVVLLALWKWDLNPEANKIIAEFEEKLKPKENKIPIVDSLDEEIIVEEVKGEQNATINT